MPPNVAIASAPSSSSSSAPGSSKLDAPPVYNENDVFSWEEVYHYVCKFEPFFSSWHSGH